MPRCAPFGRSNRLRPSIALAVATSVAGGTLPAHGQSAAWSVGTSSAVTAPGSVQSAYSTPAGSSTTADPTTRSDPSLGFTAISTPVLPGSFASFSTATLSDVSTSPQVVLGSSSAAADLGTVSLSIAETTNFGRPAAGFRTGSVRASASLADVLTFHFARPGAANIDVFWTFDAHLSGTLGNAPDGRPAGDGSGSLLLSTSMNGATFLDSTSFTSTPAGTVFTLAAPQLSGWAAFAQRATVPGDVLSPVSFHTVFGITSANPVVTFNAQLANLPLGGCANGATCSASARFSFVLPTGVTFTSASNEFLAGPVPEPSTWALMLLGTGAVAWSRRRAAGARQRLTATTVCQAA